MKKTILRIVPFIFGLLLLVSCGSDSPSKIGWTVGTSEGGYGVILHTGDGGRTWVRQGDASQLPDAGFSDICILDADTLLVTGDARPDGSYNLYKSKDGGKSWTRIDSQSLMNVSYGGLFSLGKDHVWIVGDQGTLYRSDDQGETWIRIAVPPEYQSDSFLRVAARNVDDVWVVGDQDATDRYPIMLHTTDGGTTWQRLNPVGDLKIEGGEGGHLLAIKLFGDSVWAAGGFGKFVIRSGDDGGHWSLLKQGGDADVNDLFVLSESEAYSAEDNNGIFHTSDAGLHWDDYSYNTGNWYLGIAMLGDDMWVVGSPNAPKAHSAIVHSADGGKSWTRQTVPFLENTTAGLYKVRFVSRP